MACLNSLLACREAWALCRALPDRTAAPVARLAEAFRNVDLAIAHAVYLESIVEYVARGGRSRGSFLVAGPADAQALDGTGAGWPVELNDPGAFVDRHVLEITLDEGLRPRTSWVPVRPIPTPDSWFETVWQSYRNDEVIR